MEIAVAFRHEFEESDAKASRAESRAEEALAAADGVASVADEAQQAAQAAVSTSTDAKAIAQDAKEDAAAARAGAESGVIGYATRVELEGDLDHPAHTVAYVTNDPSPENNGTYIKEGGAGGGSWEQASRGWSEQDVAGLIGGADVSPQTLIAWAEAEAYEPTAVTRDGAGVVTSASVKWPDGSAGTLTATQTNPVWLAIDAYTITHSASGRTVTQPAVTRDPATGAVTVKPQLTVSL